MTLDVHRHRLERLQRQGLRGQDVPPRWCRCRRPVPRMLRESMCGCLRTPPSYPAGSDPTAGPRRAQPLICVAQGADRHPELRAVGAQRLHLGTRNGSAIGLSISRGGNVVILGGQRQIRPARRGRWPAVRRRPVDWSPVDQGAGRCRAGPAHPRHCARHASHTFSESVLDMPTIPCVPHCGIVVSPWKRLTRSGRWSRQGDPGRAGGRTAGSERSSVLTDSRARRATDWHPRWSASLGRQR